MRQIVLVLGAGASMPYGFPSGQELKTSIGALASSEPATGILAELALGPLLRGADFTDLEISEFGKALAGSSKFSVDAFLEGRACTDC